MIRLVTLILLSLLLSSGCDTGIDSNRYFPLEKGLYWQYDMAYTTMDGRFKGVYAVENLGKKEIDGAVTYVRQLLDGSYNYILVDEQGVFLKGREKTINLGTHYTEVGRYLFRFPLQAGNSWEETIPSKVLIKTGPPQKTEFHIVAQVPVEVIIESMTDIVEVPAGTFTDCMRISLNGSAFTDAGNYVGKTIVRVKETRWYAPDVGLVKSVRQESTKHRALDKGKLVLELRQFRK